MEILVKRISVRVLLVVFLIALTRCGSTHQQANKDEHPDENLSVINYEDSTSRHYKSIKDYGIRDFVNMDLRFFGYFPYEEHWSDLEENIRRVPVDSLRYIDSLDVKASPDTLFVRMYTRNYAYRSYNTYKITENKDPSTDTLMVAKIDLDIKLRNEIQDVRNFRKGDFTVNYIIKKNVADSIDQRILFDKHFKPKNNAEH